MEDRKLPELFGSCVFNEATMKERLSRASYQAWKACVNDGAPLEIAAANEIADAMKDWAVEKGCTHYTHWFQPMTGGKARQLPRPRGRRQSAYGIFGQEPRARRGGRLVLPLGRSARDV